MPIKTFSLSSQALQELLSLAERTRLTPEQALEAIVMEFAPSTLAERHQQALDKSSEMLRFFDNFKRDPMSNAGIWSAGFRAGWRLFQTRKFISLFARSGVSPHPTC